MKVADVLFIRAFDDHYDGAEFEPYEIARFHPCRSSRWSDAADGFGRGLGLIWVGYGRYADEAGRRWWTGWTKVDVVDAEGGMRVWSPALWAIGAAGQAE
jgi:hypothetical protein